MKYTLTAPASFVTDNARAAMPADWQAEVAALEQYIRSNPSFSTQAEYDNVVAKLHELIKPITQKAGQAGELYAHDIHEITRKAPLTEPVVWGGITYQFVDIAGNKVKKNLVVGRGGTLGFEYHDFKHEQLDVFEGFCIFISSIHGSDGWQEGNVTLQLATKGDTITFLPKDEHGLIALTDCVVQETSTFHLEDLIFIFNSSQPA